MTEASPINTVALNWKEWLYNPDATLKETMERTSWPALCGIASELRGGIPCTPTDDATNGLYNMARLLRFEDGILWLARIAMHRSSAASLKLRAEIDTMMWIKANSTLPIPTVFASETDEHNAAGVAFVLMEFLPGNTAMNAAGGWDKHRGAIPESQQPRFFRDVARCHMTTLKLPQIGSVCRLADGTFKAGPIPDIGGPFGTAAGFYTAWADCCDKDGFRWSQKEISDMMRGAPETEQITVAIQTFPSRLRAIAAQLATDTSCSKALRNTGPFPLYHTDFLHSNIVVAGDEDFSVLGVIDWEGARTVPADLVQFPRFLELMPARFGRASRYGPDGQPVDDGDRKKQHAREEYLGMVRDAEAELGVGALLSSTLSNDTTQALAYAMGGFIDGKLGFYDQIAADVEALLVE